MIIFLAVMQGRSNPLETRGHKDLTALCILKQENASPSCRHIILSMLWEMNFYFQLSCLHVLTFGGKKLGGGGLPMLRPCNDKRKKLNLCGECKRGGGEGEVGKRNPLPFSFLLNPPNPLQCLLPRLKETKKKKRVE